jgi:hypothetical protein
MKVDFSEDLPDHMTPGQYKMEMQSFTSDNVQIFDEQFFMRIEWEWAENLAQQWFIKND